MLKLDHTDRRQQNISHPDPGADDGKHFTDRLSLSFSRDQDAGIEN
jgi:hypothetical protein